MESGSASADSPMEARIARLESDVSHLRTDVGDIKVDLRALRDKVDGVETSLRGEIKGLEKSLRGEIMGLKDEISSAKTWGVMLYVTLAGMMLSVMARGFGWI